MCLDIKSIGGITCYYSIININLIMVVLFFQLSEKPRLSRVTFVPWKTTEMKRNPDLQALTFKIRACNPSFLRNVGNNSPKLREHVVSVYPWNNRFYCVYPALFVIGIVYAIFVPSLYKIYCVTIVWGD